MSRKKWGGVGILRGGCKMLHLNHMLLINKFTVIISFSVVGYRISETQLQILFLSPSVT